jgi:hypothetical protein
MEGDTNSSRGDEELRRESRVLMAVAWRLVEAAREHLEAAKQDLERSRNAIQSAWLIRALRQRRRRRNRPTR